MISILKWINYELFLRKLVMGSAGRQTKSKGVGEGEVWLLAKANMNTPIYRARHEAGSSCLAMETPVCGRLLNKSQCRPQNKSRAGLTLSWLLASGQSNFFEEHSYLDLNSKFTDVQGFNLRKIIRNSHNSWKSTTIMINSPKRS